MFCCKCTKNRRISKTRFVVYSSLLLKLTRLPPYGRRGRDVLALGEVRRYVLRRRVRLASSKGEVLEVSSAAKDVEREALRIRHTVCSPSSPGKEAKDEPPCPNGILPQNQNSRNLKYLIRVTDVYDIWFSIRKRLNIYAARKEFDFRRPKADGQTPRAVRIDASGRPTVCPEPFSFQTRLHLPPQSAPHPS